LAAGEPCPARLAETSRATSHVSKWTAGLEERRGRGSWQGFRNSNPPHGRRGETRIWPPWNPPQPQVVANLHTRRGDGDPAHDSDDSRAPEHWCHGPQREGGERLAAHAAGTSPDGLHRWLAILAPGLVSLLGAGGADRVPAPCPRGPPGSRRADPRPAPVRSLMCGSWSTARSAHRRKGASGSLALAPGADYDVGRERAPGIALRRASGPPPDERLRGCPRAVRPAWRGFLRLWTARELAPGQAEPVAVSRLPEAPMAPRAGHACLEVDQSVRRAGAGAVRLRRRRGRKWYGRVRRSPTLVSRGAAESCRSVGFGRRRRVPDREVATDPW